MRAIYDLLQEPAGPVYLNLLDYCRREAKQFLLVVRNPDWVDARGWEILAGLKPHLLSLEERPEWPGTKLDGGTACVRTYAVNDASAGVLARSEAALYEWSAVGRPEDLCFLRADGSPLLVTQARERASYMVLSLEEAAAVRAQVPGLRLGDRQE